MSAADPYNRPKEPTTSLNLSLMTIQDYNDLPADARCQLTILGPPSVVGGELLRKLSLVAAHEASRERWVLNLHGMLAAGNGRCFHDVFSMNAAVPIKVRRKSWPLDRYVVYSTNGGTLVVDQFAKGEPATSSFLTPLDFAAQDWEMVQNDNVVEVMGDDADDLDALFEDDEIPERRPVDDDGFDGSAAGK